MAEDDLNVDSVLCRSLHEHHSKAIGKLLALLKAHLPLTVQVGLVANQHTDDFRCSIVLDFVHPMKHAVIGLSI